MMKKTVEYAAVFALTASVLLVGCTDRSPTTPSADGSASFFLRAPEAGFDVVRRSAPLAQDLEITRTVGPEGGRLDIEEAGISLVIPPNALGNPTEITMKALAGDAAAVEFAPHGLRFDRPATMHLRAAGTEAGDLLGEKPNGASLDSFLGVYFEGDPRHGVDPLETLPTWVLDGAIVFEVAHFSGYATASG